MTTCPVDTLPVVSLVISTPTSLVLSPSSVLVHLQRINPPSPVSETGEEFHNWRGLISSPDGRPPSRKRLL